METFSRERRSRSWKPGLTEGINVFVCFPFISYICYFAKLGAKQKKKWLENLTLTNAATQNIALFFVLAMLYPK